MALDYAVAAGCAVIIFGMLFQARSGTGFDGRRLVMPGWPLLLVLAIGLSLPVAIRRRAPAQAILLVLAACAVTLILGGAITRGPFLPLALVLYVVASTGRRAIAVAGLAGALALSRAIGSLLFELSPTDPLTLGSMAVLLASVALVASYLPARRATRVDPLIALRSE